MNLRRRPRAPFAAIGSHAPAVAATSQVTGALANPLLRTRRAVPRSLPHDVRSPWNAYPSHSRRDLERRARRSRGDSDRRATTTQCCRTGSGDAARRSTATRASRAPTPSVARRRGAPATASSRPPPGRPEVRSALRRARRRSGLTRSRRIRSSITVEESMVLEPTRHVDEGSDRRRDRDAVEHRAIGTIESIERWITTSSERMFRSLGTESSIFAVCTPSNSQSMAAVGVRNQGLVAGPEHRGQRGLSRA